MGGYLQFPLAELELNRSGRQIRTYVLRTLWGGYAALTLVFMLSTAEPEAVSESLVAQVRIFQALVVLILAPLVSAGLIAKERQENTLALLLMADLRGWDVLLAKYLAALLQVELLILSALPILAIASFFGGVSGPDIVRQTLLACLYAAIVCAVGIFCSTHARRPAEALLGCMLFICGWIGLSLGADWIMASRGITFATSGASALLQNQSHLAYGVIIDSFLGLSALIAAALFIPRAAFEKPRVRTHTRRLRRFRRATRTRSRAVALLLASGAPGIGGYLHNPIIRGLAMIGLAGIAAVPCVGWLIILTLITYDVAYSINVIRNTGALDDIMVSPMGNRTLARSILMGQLRRSWIFLPASALLGLPIQLLRSTISGPYDLTLLDRFFNFMGSHALIAGPLMAAAIALAIFFALTQLFCIISITIVATSWNENVVIQSLLATASFVAVYLMITPLCAALSGLIVSVTSFTPIPALLAAIGVYALAAFAAGFTGFVFFDSLGEGFRAHLRVE